MFQKQTFGSTNTGFGSFNAGASTSSPFSGFKPATGATGFGAPPAFGANATPQPAPGGGLFGSTNTTGGLFGGNTATSTGFGTTSGFGFGATTSSGGLFNNSSSGLFGNNQNNSAFGAKPATNNNAAGFGSGTTHTSTTGGLFGSTPSTSTGLFGQQNTSIGGELFGNTSVPAFGQPATTSAPSLFGSSISSTPAFGQTNTSSFGGGTQTNTQTMGLFGANKPAFGATPTPAGTELFAATTTPAPAVGTNTTTFGFGANTRNENGGLFNNKPATSGFGTSPSTGFGGFGAGLFAKTNTTAPTFDTTTPGLSGLNIATEENNRLESELHEREKELNKLQTNFEMLMHEYQKLKNQQGIDSEVMQKVMQQAGEWYKQNKRLQRKCNALMLALPSGVELDLDATDAAPDTSSNEEVEFLKRTLSEMCEQVASMQTDANADNVHMLEQTKEIQQLRNRMERHNRVSKLLVEMSELKNNADESIQMTEIKKLTILELDQHAAWPKDTVEELQLKKAEKHEDTVILSWEKKIKLAEEDAKKALERAERAEKKLEELQQMHAENRKPGKPNLMSIINNFETKPAPLQEPTPKSPPPSPPVLGPPSAPPLPPPPAVLQSFPAEDMAAMLANKGASLKKTKENAL